MSGLRRLADAVLKPIAEHEAESQAAYEQELFDKYARGMGLDGSREERYAAHKRATEVAPTTRLALHRR